ncbi:hypothetical protein EKO23_02820 [Nocardioides guangzhouensis]|uniref:ATP-grasp domain-containing protein n=1 Tax=Nocardioides guangzhouensis TaxID=2497878 RepID=A0A4Q4ZLF9_9ACTN|nr:hypothetical protein [Nocardioides guangzhouensis]RYP88284.1 hypothetical protein EKO23_02820 [Nocardioides guangzhouensis]
MVKVLVLAHADDRAASRLVASLGQRGVEAALVTDLRLATSARFAHRPVCGPARADGLDAVWLDGDTELSARTIGCVYSRLVTVTPPPFVDASDRDYARVELEALLASWLHGLGSRVVNRAGPAALAGPARDLVSVLALAREVGLAIPAVQLASSGSRSRPASPGHVALEWPDGFVPASLAYAAPGTGPPIGLPALRIEPLRPGRCHVLVAGDTVTGAPGSTGRACRDLAQACELDVCDVQLAETTTGRLVCVGLDAVPTLSRSDHREALADHLVERAHRHARQEVPA